MPTALVLTLAAGFLLRFLFLLEFRETPYYLAHLLSGHDQRTWVDLARQIIAHPWAVHGEPFYQAPGYAYFLALVFRVFGAGNYLAAALVQITADTAGAGILFLVGRRLWNERTGLAACLVYAFYRPFVIYSVTMLSDSFILFGNLLCLLLFLRTAEKPEDLKRWALAGLAFGISTTARPTVLVFLLLAGAAFLFPRLREEISGRRLTAASFLPAGLGIFSLFFLLPVLPLVIRNSLLAGHFVSVGTYGGINWEIGNSANSIGLYLNPFDPEAPPLGPLLSPFSTEFWRLQARKALFFITAYEWPQNLNLYLLTDISRVLSRPLFNIGLIMPMGLAGLLTALNRRQHWVFLYTAGNILAVVAIFVTSRYRIPAMAGLILCACGLFDLAWRTAVPALKARKMAIDREFKLLAGALCLLAVFSYALVNTWTGKLVTEVYARNYRIMTSRAIEYYRGAGREDRAAAIERRFHGFAERYRTGKIR